MIKMFNEWINESFNEDELRQAERDTMEYDHTLDADEDIYPDFEDDFISGEEEEEEEEE